METTEIKGLFEEMDGFFADFENDSLKKKLPTCNPEKLTSDIKNHAKTLLLAMYENRNAVDTEMTNFYNEVFEEESSREELEDFLKSPNFHEMKADILPIPRYFENLEILSDEYRKAKFDISFTQYASDIIEQFGFIFVLANLDSMPEGRSFVESHIETINASVKHVKQPSEGKRRRQPKLDKLLAKLDGMTGLAGVKQEVKSMIDLMKVRKMREEAGMEEAPMSLHLVFSGNPGTGKTTVARLLGQIYRELGVLETGQLIEVGRADLVAGYIGHTAQKTREKFQDAMGGILFIDEAYTLVTGGDSDFGKEAINELLALMENYRSDIIVIIAGYTKQMKTFIDANPGLQSRFSKYIEFADFDAEEMTMFFKSTAASHKYILGDDEIDEMRKYFMKLTKNKPANFGNGRDVRNIFEKVIQIQSGRIAKLRTPSNIDLVTISLDDLMEVTGSNQDNSITVESLIAELNAMTGLTGVKREIESIVNIMKVRKMREENDLVQTVMSNHLIFSGSPGTGKTTVARLVGKIYKQLGLLSSGHIIETDRAGLVAGYVGQTAIKTKEVCKRAMGGILFIDEAYTLTHGNDKFGQEAIDTLLTEMENNRDNFVVICAGYNERMERFIQANPGLQSRFNKYVNFEDYDADELLGIFTGIAKNQGYVMTPNADRIAKDYFANMAENKPENFGNGRTVRNTFEKIIAAHAERIVAIKDVQQSDLITIDGTEFQNI